MQCTPFTGTYVGSKVGEKMLGKKTVPVKKPVGGHRGKVGGRPGKGGPLPGGFFDFFGVCCDVRSRPFSGNRYFERRRLKKFSRGHGAFIAGSTEIVRYSCTVLLFFYFFCIWTWIASLIYRTEYIRTF